MIKKNQPILVHLLPTQNDSRLFEDVIKKISRQKFGPKHIHFFSYKFEYKILSTDFFITYLNNQELFGDGGALKSDDKMGKVKPSVAPWTIILFYCLNCLLMLYFYN